MRRRLILCLSLLVLGQPALASESKEKAEDAGGLYVDISTVGLPVIQDRRLVNYVFAQVRLVLSPGTDPVSLRTKEPYFRDALVRAAHRTPFTVPGDPNRLDEAALKRVLAAEAARIAGPRAIASIQVMTQQAKARVRLN